MRVIFVASDRAGGGRVRSFWPATALREAGVNAWALQMYPKIEPGDVVIIHRPLAGDTLERVRAAQAAGAVVLVDEDDDLTSLPASNKFQPAPGVLARHDEAIRIADGLTVTTAGLEQVYGAMARRSWIVANALPEWVGAVKSSIRDGRVRVGWAGIVGTHSYDLDWFAPVANATLRGATFTTVGDGIRTTQRLGLVGVPVEAFEWQTEPEALYKLMAYADIGIVPLAPCAFNVSKSGLKALEYQTLGKPVVVCDLPEQRAVVVDGETGFVAASPEEFADCVQRLVHDEELRTRMGAAARRHGRALSLERSVDRWRTVCEQAATVAA